MSLGAVALASACNAIVGNGDLPFATDAGTGGDATAGVDARAETAALARDAGGGDRGSEPPDVGGASPEAMADPDAACPDGTKRCGTLCAALDDPAYGCSATGCAPCELPNAVAGCGPLEGGADAAPDGGPLACSVAVCKDTHRDCNGAALDGCEIDTSDDLRNCGACGVDCTHLPHVVGSATCVAGACAFDSTACASGYGICTNDPNSGCDTLLSDPAHCGACTTVCSAGLPDCSPSSATAGLFACTSGCAAGFSLCGGSCVDEETDPNHCGGCDTACPLASGGSPTCSGGASCSFTCNAENHVCGVSDTAFCAANDDATHCGAGAACQACQAPAQSTPTCTGGTTCGHVCNAGAHACGGACPLDTDPNNCGTQCGTNCPGPTGGTGSASCNGDSCAITCGGSASLCGTACVDELTDPGHCGSCDVSCAATQTCSGGRCVCNATSCPGGCCDAAQVCQPAACGTGGVTCAAGCPTTVPEAANLILWLVGDAYTAGPTWHDLSGRGADASCSTCPSTGTGLNGHNTVSFDGSSYFVLSDPGAQYRTQSWTIFVVAAPDPAAPPSAELLAFSSGSDSLALQRSGGANDLLFELVPGSAPSGIVAPGAWAGTWEQIVAAVDATQSGSLEVGGSTATATIGSPAPVDHLSAYLGTDPASRTQTYVGQVAEVLVFNTTQLPSASNLQAYLSGRYNLP
jgi:hypothetical protein